MAARYINFSGNLSFSGAVAVEDGDSPGGGDEELPDAPEGFAYLVNQDGAYIVNKDDAFILAKAQ